MRIAFSDYDGTLKQNGAIAERDLRAIHDWRAAGNRFGIATGRDLGMALHEIRAWSIPFDALICMNGSALFDADLRLLGGVEMAGSLVEAIVSHPAARQSLDCKLLGDDVARVVLVSPESRFPATGLPYREVSFEEAGVCRGIRQINFSFASADLCQEWGTRLMRDLGDSAVIHSNTHFLDITPPGVGKEIGIESLLKHKGWTDATVLTIGDGGNDEGMIRRFGGFAIASGEESVIRAARRVYATVGDMLNAEGGRPEYSAEEARRKTPRPGSQR